MPTEISWLLPKKISTLDTFRIKDISILIGYLRTSVSRLDSVGWQMNWKGFGRKLLWPSWAPIRIFDSREWGKSRKRHHPVLKPFILVLSSDLCICTVQCLLCVCFDWYGVLLNLCVWNLVTNINGGTQTEGVLEQSSTKKTGDWKKKNEQWEAS
jgi:hypothetical protein